MKKIIRAFPDKPPGEPKVKFEDTFCAETALLNHFFGARSKPPSEVIAMETMPKRLEEVGPTAEDDIEITPEMIEAGVDAMASRYLDVQAGLSEFPEIARIVYWEMEAVRRSSREKAVKVAEGWQPIESAPKQELDSFNEVLLACKSWHSGKVYVTTGFWDEDEQEWLSASNHNGYEHETLNPTHWMPLPAHPEPRS